MASFSEFWVMAVAGGRLHTDHFLHDALYGGQLGMILSGDRLTGHNIQE